jgi:hypothetical protein
LNFPTRWQADPPTEGCHWESEATLRDAGFDRSDSAGPQFNESASEVDLARIPSFKRSGEKVSQNPVFACCVNPLTELFDRGTDTADIESGRCSRLKGVELYDD